METTQAILKKIYIYSRYGVLTISTLIALPVFYPTRPSTVSLLYIVDVLLKLQNLISHTELQYTLYG